MSAVLTVLAAQGDVPQNPWPFVIIGYVVMGLGLVAVAVASTVRARRLAQRVPAGERRWLDVRANEAATAAKASAVAATASGDDTTGGSGGGGESSS